MDNNLVDIRNHFYRIEMKYKLFELEIAQVKIWQYIRFPIYQSILEKSSLHEPICIVKKRSLSNLFLLGLISFKNFFKKNAFFGKKTDILVLTFPRRKKIGEKYWDIYTDYLLDDFKNKYQALEGMQNGHGEGHKYPPQTNNLKYLDFLIGLSYFLTQIIKIRLKNEELIKIEQISEQFSITFGIKIDLVSEIKYALKRRKTLRLLIKRILNIYKPKILLEVNYGAFINMVFNEICKEREITSIELQHGIIGSYQIYYDYPKNVNLDVFPDYFFSFGEFWVKNTNLPLKKDKIIATGYPYLEFQAMKHKKKFDSSNIIFISSRTIGKELSKFAVELSSKIKNKIVFKLHPWEYSGWKKEYPWLLNSQVNVIDDDTISLYELLTDSIAQVGVYSTAIFEGLVFNLKTFIYKIPGYENMEFLYKNNYVNLISSCNDLIESLNDSKTDEIDVNFFFKRDSLENQKKVINNLLKFNPE